MLFHALEGLKSRRWGNSDTRAFGEYLMPGRVNSDSEAFNMQNFIVYAHP